MTNPADAQSGGLETPEDAGLGPAGIVRRWTMEWELSSKTEEAWRKSAKDVIERFRDEKESSELDQRYSRSNRYNILFSNVQTICPALYNQTPKPDVRRRYRDDDNSGKMISEVIERALSYTMDANDIDRVMKSAVLDSQLPGRGVTRVKYEPTFGKEIDELGQEFEALKFEDVTFEHVHWSDFRRGPGRTWEEVEWIGFRHLLTREEATEKFGPVADDAELDYSPEGMENDDSDPVANTFKRMEVWEIWSKETREVIFIAPSLKERPLKVEKDPLGLEGFFPIPRPLYAIESTESLVPLEPFKFYRDQAMELDEITKRISGVVKACKVRGIYDSTMSEMATLMDASENMLMPAQNVLTLAASGGLEKAVWIWPIEKVAQVLVHLYQQREVIKSTIYEITGIADIMRGSSNASETLGAQQLKAQFGSMRLEEMRREVQRYGRDLVRLAAEIISEKFRPETLMAMTGLMVTPDMLQIMRLDGPRGFRIDIETNSTVSGDAQAEQKAMTDLIAGIGAFVQTIGPAVQTGYIPMEAAKAIMLTAVRRFKAGREVEDALDQIGQGGQQEAGGMASQQAAQQAAMAEQAKAQQAAQAEQAKQQAVLAKAQADMQMAQMDLEIAKQEHAMRMTEMQAKHQIAMTELIAKQQSMHMMVGAGYA